MTTTKELQDAYSGLGLPAFVAYFETEAENTFETLLRPASTPEHVAADNFNRGRIAALQELSSIFKKLKS